MKGWSQFSVAALLYSTGFYTHVTIQPTAINRSFMITMC